MYSNKGYIRIVWVENIDEEEKIYDDKLQIDYFSDSYLKFEEDFYRYSAMDIPLTFLTDDIMREMAISQKNYFY